MSSMTTMMTPTPEDGIKRTARLEWPDILVIVLYFAIVIGFGIWASCKNRGSVGGYFLAGRNMNFILVGASLFASNIGSEHFIGLAGSGAASGIGIAVFELNAVFILMLLGWVFVPVYLASGVYTMPEYIRRRFGGQRIRVYLAVLALLLSIFTKISANLYAGAVFIEQSLGLNVYVSVIIILAIAALFTIAGGLTAVIWTDFIQTVIMIIGAVYLMIASFVHAGGFENLKYKYMRAIPDSVVNASSEELQCIAPRASSFHFVRGLDDPLPWPGVFFGLTVSGVWYWCSDQVIVQRTLAAKNWSHAKGGCIVAGWLKMLPLWLIVLPGMISRVLWPNDVGCATPETCMAACGAEAGCTNIAYPLLVLNLLPVAARGLMVAVMLSAIMSSLTSIFNSSSTIFTVDVWSRIRRNPGTVEMMIVGRVSVLVMAGIGIAWIPIIKSFAELFHYVQSVTSYLAPPICAVYVLAVLWKRTNEKGAFSGLMVGLAVGLTRFIWENVYARVGCGHEEESKMPDIIGKVHYLHFGIILFFITFFVTLVVSACTEAIPDQFLVRLTFWDRFSVDERMDISEAEHELEREKNLAKDGGTEGEVNAAYTGSQSHIADTTGVDIHPDDDTPWYKTCGQWICGIEKQPTEELTDEQKRELEAKKTSLDEVSFQRKLCNVMAVILLTITVFLWGFFA